MQRYFARFHRSFWEKRHSVNKNYDIVDRHRNLREDISIIWSAMGTSTVLRWRHNGRDSVSNHQPHDCLLNHLFRLRSKKTSKLRVTGLCVGNSPGTGEFPAQMASYAENVPIWWRHHVLGNLHVQEWLGYTYYIHRTGTLRVNNDHIFFNYHICD